MNKKKRSLITVIIIVAIIAIGALVYFLMNTENSFLVGEPKLKLEDFVEFKDDVYTSYFSGIEMMDIHPSVLEDIYMIDSRVYISYVGKIPKGNKDSSMYIVFKAIKGKEAELKQKLDDYLKIHINRWGNLPEQKQLAENAQLGIKGDMVYLVIGKDAKKIIGLL